MEKLKKEWVMLGEGTELTRFGQDSHPWTYHQFADRAHPENYRREEIEDLIHAIRAKENRLVLGLPDVGLSNLLRFLVTRADLAEREVIFAYLNCDVLDDCLDLDVFFAEIVRQLHQQGLGKQPELGEGGYEQLRRLVGQVEGDVQRRVVIVVDKADHLVATVDKAFYRRLKGLTDLNKGICYIFASSPNISDLVDPDGLLFAGRDLWVGPFNKRDCDGAIAEEGQRLGVAFDPTDQWQLARLAGGHPGLLRAISSAIVEEKLDLSGEESVLVEQLLSRADVKARCQRVWEALKQEQQAGLWSLVLERPDSGAVDTLAWLQNCGLVKKDEGEYRPFSPIFGRFVAGQEVPSSSGAVTIVGGKVFRGDEEVHLRPLEQKLLACLMAEPGRVYTHDEIAWSVWDIDGVTPEMINGLVSQLRARLGKDYIKTHYRRGYEFVPPR